MYLVLSVIGGGQRGASHVFGREGGVIGRSSACDWTLHDPSNTISGRHAAISFADNRFFITDTSTNGTFLNGAPNPIGKGRAAPLRPGDRFTIGSLTVSAEFADRADDAPHHHTPHPPAAGNGYADPPRARPPGGASDPFAGLTSSPHGGAPADLLESLAAPLSAPSQPRRGTSGGGHLDDLVGGGSGAGGFVPSPAPAPSRPAASVMPQAAASPAPAAPAPAGGAAFPDYLSVDYLLSGVRPEAPPAAVAPMPDQPPPDPVMQEPEPEPQVPSGTPPHDGSSELSPALRASYVSLGDAPAIESNGATGGQVVDPVSMLRQRSEARDRARTTPVPAPGTASARPFAPAASPAPAAPRPPTTGAVPPAPAEGTGGEATAFWDGLGVQPENVSHERREELLAEVGRSLRELGQGLVEVLAARRSVKDEFRIEQTMLQASENNPFKFFPTGEKALARIVVGDEGYMPLDEAVRESLRDIKAHEVAAMAALQAAVSHVLSRLDPKQIEGEGQRGAFGGQDKKALWDKYTKLHAGFAGDIEGEARDIVGKAFMEAYERQLNQLRGEGQ